ncbi:MAG: hypothetical protein AAFV19_24145 [Pseudomonadota bacterium]
MFRFSSVCAAAVAVMMATTAAQADDVEDSINAALEAYRSGDIKTAKEEIDFASQLLGQLKAEGLSAFLPPALDGWEREDQEVNTQSMAAFGGGQMAEARYSNGSDSVNIQLMADNQMVTAMGAMFSNVALLGAMGKVKRVNGEKIVITQEGEVQTLINGRIMVQISGSADADTKVGYFEAMDIDGLKGF